LDTHFTMEEDFNKRQTHPVLANCATPRQRIIDKLAQAGAQGIILGCTETGLLVSAGDCSIPLFDTTQIHAMAAVDYVLIE